MKSTFLCALIVISVFFCCQKSTKSESTQEGKPLFTYVNPFIGTGGHGHTFPGATLPFGMMQLSPDTRLDGWDGCSGYHYSDTEIYGFSHTHLSGTGVSDYGDVLLMPTTKAIFNNGADGKEGYKSKFSHDKEIAEPGYFKVHLDDTNIDVELTVSQRSGVHQYQFPTSENQFVILDLEHRDQLVESKLNIETNKTISGYRFSNAWAKDQRLFFYMEFSHSFTSELNTSKTKTALNFINPNNETIYVKIGISAVDIDGAKQNLQTEISSKTFEEVKKEAQQTWENELQKIVIETAEIDTKVNFYTAMYHSMIAPNLYQDVDGRYRGMDLQIHQTKNFDYYTVFSLWDTYRANHPLFTLIEQNRTNDFINTFLAKFDEGGIMPIWDLSANYTGCMIGYHAIPVIADAYLKGIHKFDAEKAMIAMKHSANQQHLGLEFYKKLGFIPVEEESESVSKTLEYAYDDWCIAQMAKCLGKTIDYQSFTKRAQFYKNMFDPSSGFMRGRFRNTWFAPFDPYEVNFNYTEANAWQYNFYVPQDILGHINLLGSKQNYEQKLDDLFTAKNKTSGRNQADITGLIGQYAHGNEPSHHMAYLYNFVNKPYKTQEKVRQIITELYQNAPDGISGNEDCGQMSAWYIFSVLGFYPVTPASNQYIIGSPIVNKATINLENGKTFTIVANHQSKENKYIKSATLNGKNYEYSYINHDSIINGGILIFEMTNKPSNWGTNDAFIPKTSIDEHKIVAAPFIAKGEIAFKEKTEVALQSVDKKAIIFYALNDGNFKKYTQPFQISKASTLKVYAQKNDVKSAIIETDFYKINPKIKLKLQTKYANQYNAGGENALIDGVLGTEDFRTGTWQGYFDENVIAVVDLGEIKNDETSVKINFLQDQRSWIFLPTSVECLVSADNQHFKSVNNFKIDNLKQEEDVKIEGFTFKIPSKQNIKFIKIIAKKLGNLPKWHLGYPDGKGWIFVDEIQIQ